MELLLLLLIKATATGERDVAWHDHGLSWQLEAKIRFATEQKL